MSLTRYTKILQYFTILSASISPFVHTSYSASRSSDSTTLVALYDTCGGPNWTNHANWKSTSVLDNWYGVTMSGGRVSRLALGNNGLTGSFPRNLKNLTALVYLALDSNQLSGSIPDLGPLGVNNIWLSSAETLWIQQNQLSGSIPTYISKDTNLVSLRMDHNQLSDSIITQLSYLKKLTELYLNNNHFASSLPLLIGSLSKLQYLYINSNNLTGSIPDTIGKLTNLKILRLDSNQISGSIPTSIGNDTNLQILHLEQNHVSGSLPTQIGNLTKLTQLCLNNCQFSGSLPTQIGNLTNLTQLYLNNNQFSGSVPTQIGNLTSLTQLFLNNNQFSGSVPSSFGNLRNLQNLYLNTNSLTGSIPDTFKTLTKMICLTLNDNQLSDTISSNLGNDTSLQILYLHNNQLSGPIPSTLGNISNLTILRLDSNLLSGRIPSQLGNLTNLTQLHLEKNIKIKDTIPFTLGKLSKLVSLYINSDSIYGILPDSLGSLGKLMYFDLSNNQLSDTIRSSIGSDTNLVFLNLRHNHLTGSIPSSLGNLKKLTTLNLGSNQLSGSIPSSIGNLASLPVLFLDSNQLSSSIPSSFNSLTSLDSLSLKANLLTGTVPSLANLNANLRYLNLSNDSLSGIDNNVTLLSNLNFLDVGNNQICSPALVVERWLNIFDPSWLGTQRSCTTSTVTTLDSGLVAYWNFNEGTGNTVHDSYRGIFNGTFRGASWASGISGSAANFNGHDSISIPTDTTFNLSGSAKQITISTWINTMGGNVFDSGQIIISRWEGTGQGAEYGLMIHPDGRIFFQIDPAPVAEYSSVKIPLNTWTHVAVTHTFGSASSTKMYINGVVDTGSWLRNGNQYSTPVAAPVTIGYNQSNLFPWWFNGQIDDLRLYRRALSAAEVDTLYVQQGLCKRAIRPLAFRQGQTFPDKLFLGTNAPNPFRSATCIKFGIPSGPAKGGEIDLQKDKVLLEVFNSQGRVVRILEKGIKSPGYYVSNWDGCDANGKTMATGIYIYRLTVGTVCLSERMILGR
jgi:Leucine-rich repeat (LRR) protein